MLKKYFLAGALFFAFAGPALAQDADAAQKRKLIAEIFAVQMDGFSEKKLLEQLEPLLRKQFETAIAPSTANLTSQQRSRVTDVFVKLMREELDGYLRTAMPNMIAGFENMYLTKLSSNELVELHKFLTSDLGKKQAKMTLEELPRLMEPVMQASAQMGQRIGPKMAAEFLKLESEGIRLKQP